MSLPKKKYTQSPGMDLDDSIEDLRKMAGIEEEKMPANRWEFDINSYEKNKLKLEEFMLYRKKFEQS